MQLTEHCTSSMRTSQKGKQHQCRGLPVQPHLPGNTAAFSLSNHTCLATLLRICTRHLTNQHRQPYNSIVTGSSMLALKACSHCAPKAPSTTLWSQLIVALMTEASANPPGTATTLFWVVPTARIAACRRIQQGQEPADHIICRPYIIYRH